MVLFEDDFSIDLSKWIPVRGTWEIVDGKLYVYARYDSALIKTNTGDLWTSYSVQALIFSLAKAYREAGFTFRMLDDFNYYRLIVATEDAGTDQIRRIYLHKVVGGVATEISPYRNVDFVCPLTLRVDVYDEDAGTRIDVYVNGALVYSWLDPLTTFSKGRAGIYTDQYAGLYVDDFVVESLLPTHVLSVNTTPITGIPFTLGGENMETPWTGSLSEGTYIVEMPYTVPIGSELWRFVQWEDGSTDPVRTIALFVDTTIEATYELVPPGECESYTTQTECEAAGCYWYDGACHATPKPPEAFFPRLRETLSQIPLIARIYARIDEIRLKREKEGILSRRG